MKKTLTFLLMVALSLGLYAQEDYQQEIISLKKQVNAIKYDNSKFKKQVEESTNNLNSKIATLDNSIHTTDSSVNSQANILVKNSTVIKEMKEETNAKINHVKIIAWISIILIIILLIFAIFIQIKWNKTTKLLFEEYLNLKKKVDEHIIETNNTLETRINETRKALNDQLASVQSAMENTLNTNLKTTNENIQTINNFIQESQKSNVEHIESIKTDIGKQKTALANQKSILDEQKTALANYKNELESQKTSLEKILKSETTKILADNNKNISSIKEEIEKLKVAQNNINNNIKNNKNNKKE